MVKAYKKLLCLIIFSSLIILTLSIGLAQAGATDPNDLPSTDCVEALSDVWDAFAQLDAKDMENLINIEKDLHTARFYGINGYPAVLTNQQQQALLDKFHLYYMGLGFAWTLDDYVKSHQSGGLSGYEGFIEAVQKNNRDIDYLADLYEDLRLTLPNEFMIDMNLTWDWGESERIDYFVHFFNDLKFDAAGNINCDNFDEIVNQYIIAKSNITKEDLDDVGFSCSMYQAAIQQLTSDQLNEFLKITCKMGKGPDATASLYGYVYLEKINSDDPEPNHAGTQVKVKQNGNIIDTTNSGSNGYYLVSGLNAGNYDVSYDNPNGAWKEEVRQINYDGQKAKELEAVTLLIGDMNNDGAIDILDLLWMAARMGSVTPDSQIADVNSDDNVDILDLLRVALNM